MPCDAGLGVHFPMAGVGRLQPIGQAHARSIGARRVGAACGICLGPSDMLRAGAVARHATHVEIGPTGRVGIRGEVVVLLQIGRVAIGTLVVPGLIAAGPVQWVAGLELLAGIEVEPALAALPLCPAVPGDAERLQPPTRKCDQVLL